MAEIEYEFKSAFNDKYNLVTRKIVRLLSEDSRKSISEISKEVSLARRTVVERMKRISEELGIRYTVEFNEQALNLVAPHLIAVKFSSKPDYDHIAKALAQSYIPQFAATTKGKYDMIIYATAVSSKDYAHWDKSMQIFLGEYGVEWRPSEVVHRQLGFLPLRNELLDKVQLQPKYKEMVKILNENSRTTFQEMSKRLGMHFNTVAYNFNKLYKTNYIKRFTITMDKPKDITLMSFFTRYKPREDYEKSSAGSRKVFRADDEYSLISRYLMTAPLIGAYDFFTLGAFDSFEIARKRDLQAHMLILKNQSPKMVHAEIDRVLIGRMPIRSVDTKKEYNVMMWTSDVTA